MSKPTYEDLLGMHVLTQALLEHIDRREGDEIDNTASIIKIAHNIMANKLTPTELQDINAATQAAGNILLDQVTEWLKDHKEDLG